MSQAWVLGCRILARTCLAILGASKSTELARSLNCKSIECSRFRGESKQSSEAAAKNGIATYNKKRNDAEEAEMRALGADLKDYECEIDPLGTLLPAMTASISLEDLYTAIGGEELIIAVDYSLFGFTIFGITSSGIELAQLRHKSGVETRKPVIYAMMHLATYAEDRASNSRARVEGYLKETSDELILPLQHLIRTKKHLIFVTSQLLAAFPFSTLLLDDESLFLRVALSQAPSLSTLLHLWKLKNVSDGPQETSTIPVSVCTIAKTTTPVDSGKTGRQEKFLVFCCYRSHGHS
jgi:hypothetical protein